MGSFAANSETTKVYVRYYDANNEKVSQKSYSTDLSLNEDGSLTLDDFLNSGKPFSFSFEIPDVNTYGYDITLNGEYINKETYGDVDYFYLMNCKKDEYTYYTYEGVEYINDNCYAVCFSYAKDSDEPTYIYYPYLIGGYNNVYHYDMTNESNKNEYYVSFYVYGSDSNGDYIPGYYQVYFYFNIPEVIVPDPIVPGDDNAESVIVYVDDSDGYSIANPFETGLVVKEDGTVTLTDFMYSGQPLSFKVNETEVGKWGTLEITSPTQDYHGYIYLRNSTDTDYLYCTAYGFNNVEGATAFEMPYVLVNYSNVYRYDMTEPDNNYEYCASICMNAWKKDDSSTGYFYIDIYFNLPATSGVQEVIENADAPVEFYNLNGMKVENPSNGIFIRKQGNKTSKIIVR